MSKRYYWLKLDKDFFNRPDIKIIESQSDGVQYSYFYLKLLLQSVESQGVLKYNNIPFDVEMLSKITGTSPSVVKSAIDIFLKMNMLQILENGTLFIPEVALLLGTETEDARRKREKKKEIEVELRNLNLDQKRENLENLIESLRLEEEKIFKNQNSIKENLSEIEKYSKKIVVDTNKKIVLLKENIDYLENIIESLKATYDEYLKNNILAKGLEILLLKVEKNIKDLYDLRLNKNQLKEEIRILENKIQKINILELKENYSLKKDILDETNKNLGSSEEKIEVYRKSLKNILEQEKKQKELLINLKKVENKYNKTLQIIDNVSQMGRFISKYMLANISNIASVNFNKITGRTERIEWSNEDDDKYAVYLVGQDRKIAFEQLSGGEQVSVAIAIRGTMTEYFTNSKFMILDEPTNNLDIERKKLLAEYMGEILNNLDQSIIVTHDDTFREMSEKIIEL